MNGQIEQHHMNIPWHDFEDENQNILHADLQTKTTIIGRVGIMMLACGTGAWRVRESMNSMARVMGVRCSADIGLVSIEFTCYENGHSTTQALSLPAAGINTIQLSELENFVAAFQADGQFLTTKQVNQALDKIKQKSNNYSNITIALAAGFACSAFVFLLGGGLIEMFCCLIAASLGSYVRKIMGTKRITALAGVAASVAVSCLSYAMIFDVLKIIFQVASGHEAGYIGAMLFVIPGFPFITSGLDIAKTDMRSGLERLAYALTIIVVATLVGWLVALLVHLKPENFIALHLTPLELMLLRLPASFVGVYGFSMMFNSPPRMAVIAGFVGAIANTLRLELVDLTAIPAGAAAFFGAFTAGILASLVQERSGYPRIAITVPSIVIMVPGLYFYRAVYEIGNLTLQDGANWLVKACLIAMFLPLGLMVARLLTDSKWRYTN